MSDADRLRFGLVELAKPERRRAEALVKAWLEGDLVAFHALGPAKAPPTDQPLWLDALGYARSEVTEDYALVISLIDLLGRVAAVGGLLPGLTDVLERWLTELPVDGR